ncbi:SAM-dependent methyltransferase [Merismopedia glauca CCAP 1448/3]|uniref:SAM-dependent methyltransferase n=2 Tax=Merismopedia TaxID=53402 RepID=A0A2T1C008_9CYAN|nr:SAM-dependent methyltransferase [Merismopedia glauca CCAP 1448/3]
MSGNSVLFQLFNLQLEAFIDQIKYSTDHTKIHLSIQKAFSTYFCPCCESQVHEWLDWSSSYRKVECPYCKLHPRQRLFWLHLNQHPELLQGRLKILHFAPEFVFRERFSIMPNLEYITADLNDPAVDIRIDITNIPYPDNTFNVILCSHVLEHVPDDRQAMSELWRVLKPGGWAFLQVPIDSSLTETFEDPTITLPSDRLCHYGQEDHVRMYGLDYPDRLEAAGFIVNIEDVHQRLSEAEQLKYGVLAHPEKLYFGLKSINSV